MRDVAEAASDRPDFINDEVPGGAINAGSPVLMRVLRTSADSAISTIERLVDRAAAPLTMTQQEIAAELGTAREVVSRLLKQFATRLPVTDDVPTRGR